MQLVINLTKNYTEKVNRRKCNGKKRRQERRYEIVCSVTSSKFEVHKTFGKTSNERRVLNGSLQRTCICWSVNTSQYRNYLRVSNKEFWDECKFGVIQVCLYTWFMVILFSWMFRQPLPGQGILITKSSLSNSIRHTTLGRTPLDEW
jgi:hypothetical protein